MPTTIWTGQDVNILESTGHAIGSNNRVIVEVGSDLGQDFGGGTVDLVVSKDGESGIYFVHDSITVPKAMEIVTLARPIHFKLRLKSIAEEILNGAFAADSGWTKGTGWTIAAGVASSDGTQVADADLTQTPATALVEGTSYVVIFTVSSYSAGNVTAVVGETEGTNRAANGTFTQTIVAGSGADVDIRADLDFVGDIDNVSVSVAADLDAQYDEE